MKASGVPARGAFPYWLGGGASLFFAAAFGVPVALLIVKGLLSDPGTAPWSESFFRHVILFTYGQALLSAVLSAIVGIGAALVYTETDFPGRRLLWRLSLIPFALPTLLVALGFVAVWGQGGWVGRHLPAGFLFGWTGILLGHVFLNFPLFLKGVGTALLESTREAERAALSLGASRLRCLFTITLRRAAPEIRSAFVLSFLYCASSFLIVLFLGGGPRFTTLEVAVYQAVKIQFDLPLAIRVAAIQALVSMILYGLFLRKPASLPADSGSEFLPLYGFRMPMARRLWLSFWAAALSLLVAAPLAALVGEGALSLSSMDFPSLGRATLQSVELAALTCLIALCLALPLAYASHRAESSLARACFAWMANLPVSASTLLLTVGWAIAFEERRDWLGGSLVPAAVVQAVMALPIVFRVLRDGFSRIAPELYPAAASLGASPPAILRTLELPLLRRALGLAAVLTLSFSLGEVGAVLLFGGGGIETLPLWIFHLMGRYQFGPAYGAALVLLLLMGMLFWAIGWLEGNDVRAEG